MTLLAVDRLTHRFGGVLALDHVTFDIEKGGITGLVGPNGAGKTTLFSIVAGNLRPTSGRIVFKGNDVTGRPSEKMAEAGIGRTFQQPQAFQSMSVLDNVIVAAELKHGGMFAARRAAVDVCHELGLSEIAERPVTELSAASLKRLELARALAIAPDLLLLDEVLSGLDPEEGLEAAQMVKRICGYGITILMVEHVMELLMPLCSNLIVLDQGRVIFRGTPDAARNDPKVIDAYLGTPDAAGH